MHHPLIDRWFASRFGEPTEPQRAAWPLIAAGKDTLVSAPTGSGKTLAAFLTCIDGLLRKGLAGELQDATEVVYVSPLRALSNDVRRNLEMPLAEIRAAALAAGEQPPEIRALVRTGDTPASERQAMRRKPPHILVTTPESLFLLLTAQRGRETLRSVRTVVVDEIHALVRDKRGTHLALSLERLEALCERPPLRIGLSATVKPLDEVARFLVGAGRVDAAGNPRCSIVDSGHLRELDLDVEVPETELSAVCSLETWGEIHRRLADLVSAHRSTLVFVNTRRLAERVSHQLRELLGEAAVTSHHGSLSRQTRLDAEERLKAGELKAIVATASLELGIDVGAIDLVCQIGSPRSIATFLQRVGRSGHSLGRVPKGRLFALTRDELIEALALLRAVNHRRLDRVDLPAGSLDILAQQIIAAVACDEWTEDGLFELVRRAWPYRELDRESFDAVVRMLSEGVAPGRRQTAWLHRDAVGGRLRARRGARIAAATSGGAIPDTADYRVVTASERTYVGSVNEDFAIESMAGDIFLLGNSSWRIQHVRGGEVVVEDAHGAPATIPFWLGEAPARTPELSAEVSALREEIASRVSEAGRDAGLVPGPAEQWLRAECGSGEWASRQAVRYVAAQQAAHGVVPTASRVVFERFFDEMGSMQLVIHAPFGGRINRAWGLALRKRFCRSFDFELQASADDDGILLSLGPDQSFPLESLFSLVTGANARETLVQALLAVPMFATRWRWNLSRSLAVLRFDKGRKVPAPLQRFRADDLLVAVFPAQVACQENRPGDVEIPDHPLVRQTVHDCLHEACDLDGWLAVLGRIASGEIELLARDSREPSPFSHQILNARPYAFLDDAPLEERRARAVATRRTLAIEAVSDLGRLAPEAIAQVVSEAWPLVRDSDELHDALLTMVALPENDAKDWSAEFRELVSAGRASRVTREGGAAWLVATERLPVVEAAFPGCRADPAVTPPAGSPRPASASEAWVLLARGQLECRGPVTPREIGFWTGLSESQARAALEALEGQGTALRGRFRESLEPRQDPPDEWCERRLLARIHRLTLEGLRRQIQPADPEELLRFLVEHQHLTPGGRLQGRDGLLAAIEQLQGFELPAGAWEEEVLGRRVEDYRASWLDDLTLSGAVAWGRLRPPDRDETDGPSSSPLTRVVPLSLASREDLPWLLAEEGARDPRAARSNARLLHEALAARGALFPSELQQATRLLPSQVDDALGELAALGLVSADGFAAIRPIITGARRRIEETRRRWTRQGRIAGGSFPRGGRWSLFPGTVAGGVEHRERLERWAWQLLARYGVVFRDLLERESVAPRWGELAPVYRRLEARGELRGGRFVRGVGGEQFGTSESVDRLRRIRDASPGAGGWTVVNASDPVNLAGILTPGPRVPAVRTNRLLLRGGRLVASVQAGKLVMHEELRGEEAESAARLLSMG